MYFDPRKDELTQLISQTAEALVKKHAALINQKKNKLENLNKTYLFNLAPDAEELERLEQAREDLEQQIAECKRARRQSDHKDFLQKIKTISSEINKLNDSSNDSTAQLEDFAYSLNTLDNNITNCKQVLIKLHNEISDEIATIENEFLKNRSLIENLTEQLNECKKKLETNEWIAFSAILDQQKKQALKDCGMKKVSLKAEKTKELITRWAKAIGNQEIDYDVPYEIYIAGVECQAISEDYDSRLELIRLEESNIISKLDKQFEERISNLLDQLGLKINEIKNSLDIKIEVSQIEESISVGNYIPEEQIPEEPMLLISSKKTSIDDNLSQIEIAYDSDQLEVEESSSQIKNEEESENLIPASNPYSQQLLTCKFLNEEIEELLRQDNQEKLQQLAAAVHTKSWKIIDHFWVTLVPLKRKLNADKQKQYEIMIDEGLSFLLKQRLRLGKNIDLKSADANKYRSRREKLFTALQNVIGLGTKYDEYEAKYPINPTLEDPLGKWINASNNKNKNLFISLWTNHQKEILSQVYENLMKQSNEIQNEKVLTLDELFKIVTYSTPTNSKIFAQFFRGISTDRRIVQGNFGYQNAIAKCADGFAYYIKTNTHKFKKDERKPLTAKQDLLNDLAKGIKLVEDVTLTEQLLELQQHGFFGGPLTRANANHTSQIDNGRSFPDDGEKIEKRIRFCRN